MSNTGKKTFTGVTAAVLLLGLPLAGALLAGLKIENYCELPPTTRYVTHAPFSWPMFIGLAAVIILACFPFEFRVLRWRRSANAPPPPATAFPWWGWTGLAAGFLFWILAWTRFPWFAALQQFTFTPLWFSYILVVNALTFRKKGSCILTSRPLYLARLFLASAAFWWFFEYLNRFVQNWYYEGIGTLTPFEYFVFATLPFSTVLPAVMSTCELLGTSPRSGAGLDHYIRLDTSQPKGAGWCVLTLSSAGLAGIAIYPDYLFPLLWVSPLLIITSLKAIQGLPTILSPVRQGNWRRIYLLALSALICGFFWEMWNYASLAQWKYSVPFVGRFRLFEMPVLGFAGYLPFGLECAVIADMFAGKERTVET